MTKRSLEMKRARPHAVYRFYTKDRQLLYVGCSCNPMRRLHEHWKGRKHAAMKEAMKEARSLEWEWYPSWEEAARVEAQAILDEHPRQNQRRFVPTPAGVSSTHALGDGIHCPTCGNPLQTGLRRKPTHCRDCLRKDKQRRRLQRRAAGLSVT